MPPKFGLLSLSLAIWQIQQNKSPMRVDLGQMLVDRLVPLILIDCKQLDEAL
jgi:hypothetical protein